MLCYGLFNCKIDLFRYIYFFLSFFSLSNIARGKLSPDGYGEVVLTIKKTLAQKFASKFFFFCKMNIIFKNIEKIKIAGLEINICQSKVTMINKKSNEGEIKMIVEKSKNLYIWLR